MFISNYATLFLNHLQNIFNLFARSQYEEELIAFVKERETELRPYESHFKTIFETLGQNMAQLLRDGNNIAQFLSSQ